ncbi:MAG: hypothetical protein ACREO5_10735 [Candidatus Binatia bacterium]
MAPRYKSYLVMLGLIASLLSFGEVRAEQRPPSNHATTQENIAGPEPHAIKLVSFDPWVIEGEVKGAVATYVYDDVTTERPADYWEIYNQTGDLLAVSWFDGHGVRKSAVDCAIVEDKDQLEGVFVVVVDGDSV